jgi:kynureninase
MSKATIDKLRDEATARDNSDTLRKFRERFYIPQNRIYLDGNSLGLMSRDAENATLQLLDQWRELAVEGWTEAQPDWFTLPERISELLAPLMGASPESVIVTGSTTVNLHQLLATLYQPVERSVILTDDLAFPSDVYAIESHLRLRGIQPSTNLRKVPACDGRTLTTQDIVAALDEPGIQMVILPSVIYTSGQLLDMATITASARKKNILIGWDCSHSIGAVPHELDAIGADFAFWCHYKYLNAGPGSVGGLYLNPRHFGKAPGLAGWWSSDKTKQFDMAHTLVPAHGAGALQIGTPNLLSLAPLIGSLQIHREAGMQSIREKSLALTSFLRRAAGELLTGYGIGFATPEPDADRGGHLALTHPMASALSRSLRRVGVVPDYRPPDILRLAPIALYTSFVECLESILRLQEILAAGEFSDSERELVP